MLAQELEVSLHLAFVEARQKRHEFITVEHLLLTLLDNASAAQVLRACGADLDELRKTVAEFIDGHTPIIPGGHEVDTQPTVGFQRVIQRAILHVQSSNKKEVAGQNILAALFGEKDSHAVYFLNQRNINRLDVVNYIAHGIAKAQSDVPTKPQNETEAEQEANAGSAFKESLPIAGRDGTLAGRLKTITDSVSAKTGSLTYDNSLSGYLTTSKGRLLAFSIMCNDQTVRADSIRLIDRIVAVLAAYPDLPAEKTEKLR